MRISWALAGARRDGGEAAYGGHARRRRETASVNASMKIFICTLTRETVKRER